MRKERVEGFIGAPGDDGGYQGLWRVYGRLRDVHVASLRGGHEVSKTVRDDRGSSYHLLVVQSSVSFIDRVARAVRTLSTLSTLSGSG